MAINTIKLLSWSIIEKEKLKNKSSIITKEHSPLIYWLKLDEKIGGKKFDSRYFLPQDCPNDRDTKRSGITSRCPERREAHNLGKREG